MSERRVAAAAVSPAVSAAPGVRARVRGPVRSAAQLQRECAPAARRGRREGRRAAAPIRGRDRAVARRVEDPGQAEVHHASRCRPGRRTARTVVRLTARGSAAQAVYHERPTEVEAGWRRRVGDPPLRRLRARARGDCHRGTGPAGARVAGTRPASGNLAQPGDEHPTSCPTSRWAVRAATRTGPDARRGRVQVTRVRVRFLPHPPWRHPAKVDVGVQQPRHLIEILARQRVRQRFSQRGGLGLGGHLSSLQSCNHPAP